MTDTNTGTEPTTGSPTIGSALSADTVYQLRRFRHQNTPTYLQPTTAPTVDDEPATDQELRDLLVFAGRALGNGDPTVPRHLEAHRVLSLVPETVGAALFAEVTAQGSGRG